MIVRRATKQQIEDALFNANMAFGGNLALLECEDRSGPRVPKFKVRLTVDDLEGPGCRRSYSAYNMGAADKPRRVRSACYHGYGQFMVELFLLCPDAIVEAAVAPGGRYRGAEDFLSKFRDAGYHNIGSQFYPVSFEDACNCYEHDSDRIQANALADAVYEVA